MKRVGFIVKQSSEQAFERARELVPELEAHGRDIVTLAEDGWESSKHIVTEAEFADNVDLAVVLGGDGTMLRASRIVGDSEIPVLGINLGHLGFLAPFQANQAVPTIRSALAGELPTTRRMRLAVALELPDGTTESWLALNDAVLHQGALARLLEVNAYLDDGFIASYRADGVIVATPTGSTAYNLAAGGPILLPEQHAVALTPICAHALTMRPLVISRDRTLTLTPVASDIEVQLTIDGFWSRPVPGNSTLTCQPASSSLVVFAAPGKSYFDILREKMHWGVREGSSNHS